MASGSTSQFRIASQLSDGFNQALRARVAGVEVIGVGAAPETLDPDVAMLVASPSRRTDGPPVPRPAGWPYNLKWVQLISVGVDLYPPWMLDAPTVTNTRGAAAGLLAEFALAAIFAHAKRMPRIWIDRPEQWNYVSLDRIAGQTLGIVGFGAIGQALAPRALAMGMKVQALRRSAQPLDGDGVTRADSLEMLFASSDHVVLAAPATPETAGMIDAALLAQAKPGLHLVNLARGTLIDDAALIAALDSGQVAAASLDVTDPEPLTPGHPFYTHPAVRLSPHTAVYTDDTMESLAAFIADNVARFQAGQPLHAVIDQDRRY